ncbi:MAG TPA: histidine phosphatase family protein, partial [Deltaproteobacteria bacterium]|nr:histidine phosphatase family protein [Deltaproteobacteria bacterium]
MNIMSMLYMFRHGQASFGQDNYDNLSTLGFEQARILGEHLTGIGLKIDAAYSGTMHRQEETARQVLKCYQDKGYCVPELVQTNTLNEYDFSTIISSQIPEMMKQDPMIKHHLENMITDKESFRKVFEGAMLRWVSGSYDMPGILTWKDFIDQAKQAVIDIMKRHSSGKTVAVFTSGGPICAAIKWVLGLSDDHAIR